MEGNDFMSVIARSPVNLRKFSTGITGKWSSVPAVGIYPFDTELASLAQLAVEQGRALMVDIGGAHGGTTKEIRETFPQLKGKMIVEDLESVINQIPTDFLPRLQDIETRVHDFWNEQPVKYAAVYYLRRVLHDWSDDLCQKILRHQADAMAPDSKILIADMILPDMVQREDTYCYWLDLVMMTFGGKERNETDWLELLDKSNLELVRVWRAPVGTQAVIEGRLKRK